MAHRERVRKSDTAPSTTNRLTGIVVNEVSIVDRAANQRKFLVVKDAPFPPPSAAPAPPAGAAPPVPAPAWSIAPELKQRIAAVLKTAQDKIVALNKALETATETPGAAAPPELVTELTEIGGLFIAKPAPAAPPTPPGAPAPTEKAGRKISAARLAQLLTAQETLTSLIAEVQDAPAEPEDAKEPGEKAPAKKEEGDAAPPAPAQVPAELTEIKDTLVALSAAMGKMTQVFEGQNARIETLAKSRGESRQADLDKPTVRKEARPVVWGLDMNRPLAPDAPADKRF